MWLQIALFSAGFETPKTKTKAKTKAKMKIKTKAKNKGKEEELVCSFHETSSSTSPWTRKIMRRGERSYRAARQEGEGRYEHEEVTLRPEICRSDSVLFLYWEPPAAATPFSSSVSMKMTMQQTEINNLIKENERVTEENKIMQNKNKELSRERDDLNKTLGFILKFDNFPVKDYCSDEGCEPCRTDWILFQEKCYLFYDKPSPWKSWTQSRTFCQDKHADLVVIDDLEEQKFVSNHTKYYYDIHHGYWMGLQHVNNTWTWVDGHADTLGFWVKEAFGKSGPVALLIPKRNLTENWNTAEEKFENKFICEHEAVIWSF